MMRPLKTKQLLAIATLLSLAVLSAYVFFFLSIADKNRAISVLQNDVDLVTQKESKLRSIQSVIKETEEDRARLDDYFIAEDGIVSFIEMVEGFEAFSGADIDVSSVDVGPLSPSAPSENTEEDAAELVRLSFKADGSWQEVVHTLALLESLPYQVTITQGTLRVSATVDGNTGFWKTSFTVTAIKRK